MRCRIGPALAIFFALAAGLLLEGCVTDEIVRLPNNDLTMDAFRECKENVKKSGEDSFKLEGLCLLGIPRSHTDDITHQPGGFPPHPPAGCTLISVEKHAEVTRLVYSCETQTQVESALGLEGIK
jgi:hypothetical protein